MRKKVERVLRRAQSKRVPSALTLRIVNNKRAGTARSTIILFIQMYRCKHAAIMRNKVTLALRLSGLLFLLER